MPSLLLLVLYDLTHFEEVTAAWHDHGAAELTIIDGLGTRLPREQLSRDDLPLLPTVQDLLQSDDAPRRIMFTAVPDDVVEPLIAATERVLGNLRERAKGMLIAVPISRIAGFHK